MPENKEAAMNAVILQFIDGNWVVSVKCCSPDALPILEEKARQILRSHHLTGVNICRHEIEHQVQPSFVSQYQDPPNTVKY